MFIATKPNQNLFAPLGAKHRTQQGISYGEVALLRSAGFFWALAINISPFRGEVNRRLVEVSS